MTSAGHERLRQIGTFPQLVEYLRDELGWPIESEDFEALTYEYEAEELGLDEQTAVKVRKIHQLRPLTSSQPWGIFFLDLEPKRLPVVVLRKILSNLVIKKRQTAARAHRASWRLHDLLFISAYGEAEHRDITFAHFSEDPGSGDLPALRVLGWDDEDTVRHLDHANHVLAEKLHWPTDEADVESWRRTWSETFTLRHREVITTSKALAKRLAELAKAIRKRVNAVLAVESERGTLRKLMVAFKEALIHDLTEDDFADAYAQTITYGLLAARVSRPAGLVAENVTDMVPVTNPFLRDLLATFLKAGGRRGKLDFDELGVNDVVELLRAPETKMEAVMRDFGDRNPEEDPVIHFYELFLKEYDREKRAQRGVFFTPRPVVSFIVRSVDEILRSQFGLEDGLADATTWGEMVDRHPDLKLPEGVKTEDPFVRVLDPACGTGTFLVEVIDRVHQTMLAKWRKEGRLELELPDLWNEYVTDHLLTRIYGFELMMAPYAIAHMKIGLKLVDTGYRFGSAERARIYLTNTLEPPQEFAQRILLDAPELAHEAQAVNAVKRTVPFTVVIGNPPYSIFSANLSEAAKAIVEQYRCIDGVRIRERGALKAEVILQDDYVKFLGFAQNTIRATGIGAVGMITNANCYENPVLRGARYALHRQFQLIHALDLGGQSKAGLDEDKNVFDIDTSVAVSLLVQHPTAKQHRGIARVTGSRHSKYEKLLASTSSTLCRTQFDPKPEQFLFKSFASSFGDEYDAGFPIDRAFAVTSIGIKTAHDHLVLDFDREAVAERIECLRNPAFSATKLRERFAISDNTQWKFADALPEFRASFSEEHYAEVEARPFDRRWLYFHPSLVFNTRPTTNRHVHRRQNLCLLTMRRIRTQDYAHFFVVNRIGMGEILSSADNGNFFPLYVYHDDPLSLNAGRETNFTPAFASAVRTKLGTAASDLTPEGIFRYAYAVFHSPGYRNRYAEFLKIDFPRLPLTENLELFRALARLGGKLVALHLMESPKLDDLNTTYAGPKNPEVSRAGWSENTVWLDAAATKKGRPATPGTIGFHGVPKSVWNFHIGGYQVCHKWLKDRRGRVLSDDDIAHYQKIIVAVSETIRLMGEIDEVIEEHGGWPDAFVTRSDGTVGVQD